MNRIFSGIRPSGKIHLGNYLGAIKNWIDLQDMPDNASVIFGLMDYHAITTPYDPKTFRVQVLETAAEYLATGINPKKSVLMRQSHVPQHTELAWLFNTITPVSWLERLPTYKEKLDQVGGKYNHIGILDYPVLMAADILVYKSNLVPVGDDQKAHIDLANEIAKKFNSMFGETFERIKAPVFEGARIMSLQDVGKKMSKTGDAGIALTDSPDDIRTKVKRAVTDSGSEIKNDPQEKPAIANLLGIYHLLAQVSIPILEEQYAGKTYSEFKNDLAEVIVEYLRPFREQYTELTNDLAGVEAILTKSEERARTLAQETLDDVKSKMGF